MLKFSGFADLTSCLVDCSIQLKASDSRSQTAQQVAPKRHCLFVECENEIYTTHVSGVQRHPDTQLHPSTVGHVTVLE